MPLPLEIIELILSYAPYHVKFKCYQIESLRHIIKDPILDHWLTETSPPLNTLIENTIYKKGGKNGVVNPHVLAYILNYDKELFNEIMNRAIVSNTIMSDELYRKLYNTIEIESLGDNQIIIRILDSHFTREKNEIIKTEHPNYLNGIIKLDENDNMVSLFEDLCDNIPSTMLHTTYINQIPSKKYLDICLKHGIFIDYATTTSEIAKELYELTKGSEPFKYFPLYLKSPGTIFIIEDLIKTYYKDPDLRVHLRYNKLTYEIYSLLAKYGLIIETMKGLTIYEGDLFDYITDHHLPIKSIMIGNTEMVDKIISVYSEEECRHIFNNTTVHYNFIKIYKYIKNMGYKLGTLTYNQLAMLGKLPLDEYINIDSFSEYNYVTLNMMTDEEVMNIDTTELEEDEDRNTLALITLRKLDI